MAILTADQSTVDAQHAKLQDGDTLQLQGPFADWRPKARSFAIPVTFDCTNAQIAGLYFAFRSDGAGGWLGPEGYNFVGGQWTGGVKCADALRFDKAKRMSVTGFRGESDNTSSSNAMKVQGCDTLTVTDFEASGFRTGMACGQVSNFAISKVALVGLGSDGIDLFGARDGFVEDVDAKDFAPISATHPDLIQLDSPKGGIRTTNVRISRITGVGNMQGVTGFDHPDTGDQGFGVIVVEDIDLELAYPQGVAFNNADDLTLRRCTTRTLAGAQYQCRINCDNNVKVTREANAILPYTDPNGVLRAGVFEAGWVDPHTPPAPSSPFTPEQDAWLDARYALKA